MHSFCWTTEVFEYNELWLCSLWDNDNCWFVQKLLGIFVNNFEMPWLNRHVTGYGWMVPSSPRVFEIESTFARGLCQFGTKWLFDVECVLEWLSLANSGADLGHAAWPEACWSLLFLYRLPGCSHGLWCVRAMVWIHATTSAVVCVRPGFVLIGFGLAWTCFF